MTVNDLYYELGVHLGDANVVFTTGDDQSPGGYPEWHGCYVRYNEDLKAVEIIVRDQRAP